MSQTERDRIRRENEALERKKAEAERRRKARLEEHRRAIESGEAEERRRRREAQAASRKADRSLARNSITAPSPEAERLHLVLVDNSGSNRRIAEHLRGSIEYLMANLQALDPNSQMAFMFFSDHGDGDKLRQDVDWVTPNEAGDKIMLASIDNIQNANGFDEPEAIECILDMAAKLNFGHVAKEERHLYLVTDVVAHGMGMSGDYGCPVHDNAFWREALQEVGQTFGTFQLVGTADVRSTAHLQEQFITCPERLAYDFVDVGEVPSHRHRCGITGNSLLFLIARNLGPQVVEGFLMALYEKWLCEPIFGKNTDLNARQAISRFIRFLEMTEDEKLRLEKKIFT